MYRYECLAYVCKENNVYWSETYVNNRTLGRNIKTREEEMTKLHREHYPIESHNHIVKRRKVKS